MTDNDLDTLLNEARPEASEPASALSRLAANAALAAATKAKASKKRRWVRPGILVPVGIVAVALSAATTYGAYQLSTPPFVQTEPGVERVTEPISLDYTTDKGTVLDCDLYLEFTDVTQAQRHALNALSRDAKWKGFGQSTYDRLPDANRATQNGPEPLWSERANDAVNKEALATVPGLKLHAEPGTPSIHGATTRCEYPEGQR